MCGTDYNANVKKIGPVNAFKLIQEHRNIESIVPILEKKNKDTSVLKYQLCRSIFHNKDQSEAKETDVNFTNIYKRDDNKFNLFKFKHNIY